MGFADLAVQRDERVLIVWSDSIDSIIPTCRDFEERLIKLLWRSRPTGGMATSASMPTITSGGGGMSAGAGGSMTGIIPGVNGMPPPPVSGGEDGDVDDELLPAMTDADFTAQQTFMSQSKDNLK